MMIADTGVLVDFLRGRGEAARVRREIETRRLCTTAVTAFELWTGAVGPQQLTAVEVLLAALTILPLDTPGARRAGEVRRELERREVSIAMADSLIAGVCLEHDGTLLTRNRKHFERVAGLRLGLQR